MFPDESEPTTATITPPIEEFSPGMGQSSPPPAPPAEPPPVTAAEPPAPKPQPQRQPRQPKQPAPPPQPERTAPELKGPPIAISTLQALSIAELNKMAREMEVENFGTMRKQEVIFAILKKNAESAGGLFAEGVLEVLSEGFGFLR